MFPVSVGIPCIRSEYPSISTWELAQLDWYGTGNTTDLTE